MNTKQKNLSEEKMGQLAGTNPALAAWMQEFLENARSKQNGTAISAAVVSQGEVLSAACAGSRGTDDSPADLRDLYNIGSVSKIYVTAAIMKLVQDNKLKLDGRVTDYLPNWRLADERYHEITVRMLLDHSSGIPGTNEHDTLQPPKDGRLYTGRCRNTAAYWQSLKLRAKPGLFSCYGNDNFDLAAEVIEGVTGEPYIEWLKTNITDPAGLFSTGAGHLGTENRRKVACKGMLPEYYNCFGAGAIHTTITDCALFGYLFVDSAFRNRLPKPQNENKSSSFSASIRQEYLDQTRIPQGKTFLKKAFDASNFCLGWDSLYTRNKIPLGDGTVIKDGGTEQFESYLLVSPACRLSMVICMTADCNIFLLEVLEEIGRKALSVTGKQPKPSKLLPPEKTTPDQPDEKPKKAEPTADEQRFPKGIFPKAAMAIPDAIRKQYHGIAYGSNSIYRFSVKDFTLDCEQYTAGGKWQRLDDLCGLIWNDACFEKAGKETLFAETHHGNVYYTRLEYGIAFCQKNSVYPPITGQWQALIGSTFCKKTKDAVFDTVYLEAMDSEPVLIFTTTHEEHQTIPLVCDPQKELETCLISETEPDGISFYLKDTPDGICLCSGEDCYQKQ